MHQKTLFILHQLNNKQGTDYVKGLGTCNRGEWCAYRAAQISNFRTAAKQAQDEAQELQGRQVI
jgi:hypothetical protein